MLKDRIFVGLLLWAALLVGLTIFDSSLAFPNHKISPEPSEQGSADQQQEESWVDRAIEPISLITLALVIVGAVQVRLFYWQLDLIRKSLGDAKKSADAAEVAAKAADLSARTAVSARLPNFAIELVRLNNPNFANDRITFRNYGTTPATIVADCLVLKVASALDAKPRYPLGTVRDIGKDTVVSEGDAYEVWRAGSVSNEDLALVRKGDTLLWAYGYIEYLDFMKIRRREGFCIGFHLARMTSGEKRYTTIAPNSLDWRREGPPSYTYAQQEQK